MITETHDSSTDTKKTTGGVLTPANVTGATPENLNILIVKKSVKGTVTKAQRMLILILQNTNTLFIKYSSEKPSF